MAGAAIVAAALVFSDAPPEPRAVVRAPVTNVGPENPLETEVPPPPAPPRKPPPPDAGPYMPNGHRPVRTPDDSELPPWCPVTGRLTVVESSDIAKNLGLDDEQRAPPRPAPYIMGETFVDAR